MRNLLKKITKYPVSTLITLVIWILCFMPIPETPLSEIFLIDKWTHIAMYVFLCAALWAEYLRCHSVSAANSVSNGSKATTKIKTNEAKDKQPARWSTAFLLTFILPVVMGGLIEILQANCTGGRRSGDWLDWLADSIGVVLGDIIGILLVWYLSTKKKDC